MTENYEIKKNTNTHNNSEIKRLIKPTLAIKVLQGQFRGFHFLISFLNPTRESLFFISVGICFQILEPKYEADSLPLKTLWTGSTRDYVVCLR